MSVDRAERRRSERNAEKFRKRAVARVRREAELQSPVALVARRPEMRLEVASFGRMMLTDEKGEACEVLADWLNGPSSGVMRPWAHKKAASDRYVEALDAASELMPDLIDDARKKLVEAQRVLDAAIVTQQMAEAGVQSRQCEWEAAPKGQRRATRSELTQAKVALKTAKQVVKTAEKEVKAAEENVNRNVKTQERIDGLANRRVPQCGSYLTFAEFGDEGQKKLIHGKFCKDKLCPMCSWRLSLRNTAQLIAVLNKLPEGCRLVHIVLTDRNATDDTLRESIKKLHGGLNRMAKEEDWFKRAVRGYYWKTEVTYSDAPEMKAAGTVWHQHTHVLLVVDEDYYTSDKYIPKEIISNAWRRVMQDDGLIDVYMTAVGAIRARAIRKQSRLIRLFRCRKRLQRWLNTRQNLRII